MNANSERVGLIIGSNRGIGRALAMALGQLWGAGDRLYLTARRAEDAAELEAAVAATTAAQVTAFTFDLADEADAALAARRIEADQGGIDVLFQNGAYVARAGRPARDDARPMIAANSHGTLRVLEAFLPLLRPGGRLVIVASGLGTLDRLPGHLQPLFDADRLDPAAVNRNADGYVAQVEAGEDLAAGWPEWVNVPSKVAQVAVTRAFARQARDSGALPSGGLLCAACPGVTLTDATREYMGTVFREEDAQTPEEAALGLLRLLDNEVNVDGYCGELVQQGRVLPFKGAQATYS